jgi:ectoine hydroxylase-related dioxygenase (phytanoyl-CoA dioxygenase family)
MAVSIASGASVQGLGASGTIDVARFYEQGFLSLSEFASADEVEDLRRLVPPLFAQQAGRAEGSYYDLVTHDADDAKRLLPTIINPHHYSPELRRLKLQSRCLEVARQILGPSALPAFQHAILKPAHEGSETPWHQDEAYRFDDKFAYDQLSIWIPLQPVTLDNGCMVYLPKSHESGVLAHRSFRNDRQIQAIECTADFDRSAGVACPMPAGGATLHHGRTLHYASPNRTDKARYAYILVFESTPRALDAPRDLWWLREKESRGLARKRQWRRRGGVLIEAGRKLRDGVWRSPRRIVFEIRRGWHWLSAWMAGKDY